MLDVELSIKGINMLEGHGKSAVPENQYVFHCPITNTNQRYIVCAFRRYKCWRGEEIDRGDCATCMTGGKCPAVHMMQKEVKSGERLWFDLNPNRVHQLAPEIADRVKNILLHPAQAAGRVLTEEMKQRLFGNPEVVIPGRAHFKNRDARLRKTEAAVEGDDDSTSFLENTDSTADMLNHALENDE